MSKNKTVNKTENTRNDAESNVWLNAIRISLEIGEVFAAQRFAKEYAKEFKATERVQALFDHIDKAAAALQDTRDYCKLSGL